MKPKNTICLWFDKDAQDAARFYAATFPNSEVTAVHKAPGDYPSGKAGDEEDRRRRHRGGATRLTTDGAGARSTLIDSALSLDSVKTCRADRRQLLRIIGVDVAPKVTALQKAV